MIDASIATRVEQLRQELNVHNHRYYVLDDPVVSDAEYDQLMQVLFSPGWVLGDRMR